MKNSKRRTYEKSDLVSMITNDLKEMNLSPRIIDVVVDSYLECKKQALSDGGFVREPGISTAEILIRRVSKRFSEKRYTVKIKESIDGELQNSIMSKLDNDGDFQDIMDFNPSIDIND